MSNIGKKLITIPQDLSIHFKQINQQSRILNFISKYGKSEINLNNKLLLSIYYIKFYWSTFNYNISALKIKFKKIALKKDWGTFKALIENNIIGLSKGFSVQLMLIGLGYKAYIYKNKLLLLLGYSHGISYTIPKNIDIILLQPTLISIYGIIWSQVKNVATNIYLLRKVEPYKGKGIQYLNQSVRRKKGKKKA